MSQEPCIRPNGAAVACAWRTGARARCVPLVGGMLTRRLRVAHAAPLLAHFGLTLDDWQGSAFQLANRTGGSELVADLAHLWAAAERLAGRACDPLDPQFVAALEAADAQRHA